MVELVVWSTESGNTSAKVWLNASDAKSGSYTCDSLAFSLRLDTHVVSGAFVLERALEVPQAVVKQDDARLLSWEQALRVADEAARRAATEALTNLRSKLAKLSLKCDGTTSNVAGVKADFLGIEAIGAQQTKCELEVDVDELVFGAPSNSKPVLKARAAAEFAAGFHTPFAAAAMGGSVVIEVELTKQAALELVPRIDVPLAPHLAIHWPRVALPSFSLDGVDLSALSRLFDVPLPSIVGDMPLTFVWTSAPEIAIQVASGVAAVKTTTAGAAELRLKAGEQSTVISEVSDIRIDIAGDKIDVKGQFATGTHGPVRIVDELVLPPAVTGPFIVRLADVDISGQVSDVTGHPKIDIVLSIGRCEIKARSDPSLVIAVAATITFSIADGRFESRLTSLDLIEPYPIKLVAAAAQVIADGARQLWSLVQRIPIPDPKVTTPGMPPLDGVIAVLRRLGELAAAAARWFAEQGLAAARGLAGLAEAAMRLIADLLAKIVEAIAPKVKRIFEAVVIELRIDTRAWRLVQIVVTPVDASASDESVAKKFLGLELEVPYGFTPSLVYDLEGHWLALLLQMKSAASSKAIKLSTDLWLERRGKADEPVAADEPASGAPEEGPADDQPLFAVTATPKQDLALALVVVRESETRFFQKFVTNPIGSDIVSQVTGSSEKVIGAGHLFVATRMGEAKELDGTEVTLDVKFNTDRVLSLFRSPKPDSDGEGGSDLAKKLSQYIKVKSSGAPAFNWPNVSIELEVAVTVSDATLDAKLAISLNMQTLKARIESDAIGIAMEPGKEIPLLGLKATFIKLDDKSPKPFTPLELAFTDGNPRLQLRKKEARIDLSYKALSSDGRGLAFEIDEFVVARDGIDLLAKVKEDPVTLSGIDMPFRFDKGMLSVKRGTLQAFSLAGHGNLPPSLVGEAKASINLSFAQRNGRIALQACEAVLDKSADPLRCESTRFTITITKLGLKFVEQGGYHFYFTLTGAAEFRPSGDEFSSGLLKNLSKLKIVLDEAPLASDPRVLLQHIEFQIPVEPPSRTNFFDIFSFELRGVGFHPAAPAFGGTPAFSISGQVSFSDFGDVVTPRFDFHKMWIAPPEKDKSLPRIRFDGLGVGLRLGSAAEVYGTAVAVDGAIPTLHAPDIPPSNVTGKGFLASGSLQIKGWASMSASMGFLELEKPGATEKRHAFFMYIQQNDLAEKIPTPIGTIFLREVGFGFGFRYTLAGLAAADTATTPRQLVKMLDEVSKYQGDLDKVAVWSPTYDNSAITLALRGLLSFTAASSSDSYNEKAEEHLPNLALFDIVAAIRTDLTFLMNIRLWVAYNYNDWRKARLGTGDSSWKQRPSLRGYMYLSVPRKEFLARAVFDPNGPIGDHPKLPEPLKKAMLVARWSSTLYVRPGLFHMEFGWPYELGFDIGDKNGNFYLSVEGGTVLRFEDMAVLYGLAFRARGHASFSADTGGSFGAAVSAYADFALGAKLIAYLSARISDSMFYGEITLDLTLRFSVRVWLRTDWFSLSAGFSLCITIHIAVELLLAPGTLAGRVEASVAVSAFGCGLSIGIGFTFGDGNALASARARVARFLSLGLGVDYPDPEQGAPVSRPLPEPSPAATAESADKHVEKIADQREKAADPTAQPVPPQAQESIVGTYFGDVSYWAILFPVAATDGNTYYLIQLVPRGPERFADDEGVRSHFYAAPAEGAKPEYRVRDDSLATPVFDATTDWAARFGLAAAGANDRRPTVRDLFAHGCFLAKGTVADSASVPRDYQLTDARCGNWDQESLTGDAEALGRKVADAAQSRRHLGSTEKRMQQVDEARSCFILTVAQCAEELARRVVVTSEATADDDLKSAIATDLEFDPRRIGLTFVRSAAIVDELFPQDLRTTTGPSLSKKFKVATRIPYTVADFGGSTEVALLNPPKRMFREASPRLSDIETRVLANGIQLYWDLEPAWGASASVYDDPEYHLKHYRIERHISGVERPPSPRVVTVKGADVIRFERDEHDAPRRTRLRSRLQFVDDLSDLSAEMRARILPKTNASDRALAQGDLERDVHLSYLVVPVDIAGTVGMPTPVIVEIAAREAPEKAIACAVARFDYGQHMPELAAPEVAKRDGFLSFLIEEDGVVDASAPTKPPKPSAAAPYILRVRTESTVAAGLFGADALAQARAEPPVPEAGSSPGVNDVDISLLPPTQPKEKQAVEVQVQRVAKFVIGYPAPATENKPESFWIRADDWKALMDRLEVGAPEGAVRASRIYVAPQHTRQATADWIPVQVQMRIGAAAEDHPVPVDITVDRFEHPLDVRFTAVTAENMSVNSGRLHLYRPMHGKTFDTFVTAKSESVRLVPDAERRTCAELRWNVRPKSLTAFDAGGKTINADDEHVLPSLIGGFDVFSLDAAAVPEGGDAIDQATSVARVQRLPASSRGQEPSETGDFARVEAFYPSETRRLLERDPLVQTRKRAPWYSPAESFLVWPKRVIRRSALTDVDEVELAKLFAKARPKCIGVSWQAWPDLASPDGTKPAPPTFALEHDGPLSGVLRDDVHPGVTYIVRRDGGAFSVDLARRALLSLVLKVATEVDGQAAQLTGSVFAAVEIKIVAFWDGTATAIGEATMKPQLITALHPVLTDVLDIVRYHEPTKYKDGGPRTYRRYEPVTEAAPPINAKTLTGFLDDTSADRDPAAWGALRSLGLAAAFRLFDRESGEFVPGNEALKMVDEALRLVLLRYGDVPAAIGTPFVDVMSTTDGFAELVSFHGSAPSRADADRRVLDSALALVQCELRPAVQQLAPGETRHIIRYAKLVRKMPEFDARGEVVVDEHGEWKIPSGQKITVTAKARNVLVELLSVAPATGNAGNRRYLLLNGWDQAATQGRFPIGGSDIVSSEVEFVPLDAPTFVSAAKAAHRAQQKLPDDVGLVAYVRFIALEASADVGGNLDGLLESGETLEAPIPVDTVGDDPWGRFGDLPAAWCAAMFFGEGLPWQTPRWQHPVAQDTLNALTRELGRHDAQSGANLGQIPTDTAKRVELAGRLGEWSRRLMDHGPAERMPAGKAGFALAILTRPTPWRVAPHPDDGRLSILMFEKDRYGKVRKYAVKPFGRYDNLAQAVCTDTSDEEAAARWSELAQPSLAQKGTFGGSQAPLQTHFVDAVIERTEPLAAPVILAARQKTLAVRGEDGKEIDRDCIEVIVARHPEEIVADANIRTDAGIAMRHVAIGFWREFAAPDWARRVTLDHETIDVLEPFGPFSANASSDRRRLPAPKTLVLDQKGDVDIENIRDLYEELPDLWRGAYVLRMSDMPYGFRFHAAAHVAAGVSVSPSSVASVDGADYGLELPWTRPSAASAAPWQDRKVVAPSWDVERNADETSAALVATWPLVRLVDGLRPDARSLWLGSDDAPALYRLPDPAVSYRLSIDTLDASTRVPEAEFAAIPEPQSTGSATALYLAQVIGKRFADAKVVATTLVTPTHYALQARLGLLATPVADAPQPAFAPRFDASNVRAGDFSAPAQPDAPWLFVSPAAIRVDHNAFVTAKVSPPQVPDPTPSPQNPNPTPAIEWSEFKAKLRAIRDQYAAYAAAGMEARTEAIVQAIIDALEPFVVDRVAQWPRSHGNVATAADVEIPTGPDVWILGLPMPASADVLSIDIGEIADWRSPTSPAFALDATARARVKSFFDGLVAVETEADKVARIEGVRDTTIAGMQRFAAASRRVRDEVPFMGLTSATAAIPFNVAIDKLPAVASSNPVDVVLETVISADASRTTASIDAAFDALEGVVHAGPTLEALAAMRASPTAPCAVPFLWSAQAKALPALQALSSVQLRPKVVGAVLRKPATIDESTTFGAASARLPALIDDLTSAMVLGPRRRLVLQASHGLKKPVTDEIKRKPR